MKRVVLRSCTARKRQAALDWNADCALCVTRSRVAASAATAAPQIVRDRNVVKPAPGTRKCNCKNKVVTQQLGPGMFQQYTQRVCEDCPNVKYERESEALTVSVEPGMEDGQQIMFFEEGEPLVDGEAGDLMVWLRTQPHPHFERRGMHLMVNATITLLEALVGFEREVRQRNGGVDSWIHARTGRSD